MLLGGGGREHAIAWRLTEKNPWNDQAVVDSIAQIFGAKRFQELPITTTLYVAPGNSGTRDLPGCFNVDIDYSRHENVVDFCVERGVELVIIGPEAPLASGMS